MKLENNIDGIVKNILKRRITEADVEKLTREEMKKVILSIMERQNVLQMHHEIYEKHNENDKNSIIEEVEEIIEMLQTDRGLKGKYELSPSTKEYSKNVEKDIQEIINRYKL